VSDPTLSRAELAALVVAFTDAFNREDLDAVMAFMTEDAVYDQFNGVRAEGKAAIREAFVPQFRGDYGTMRFVTEDCFVDAAAGKAMIRWVCTLETQGVKHTYAKADVPRLGAAD
jgi:uncharacterized protein (TIGR02246 family)